MESVITGVGPRTRVIGAVPAADAVENTALLNVLNGYATDAVGSAAPFIAAAAVGVKFAVVAVVLLYVAVAPVWFAVVRERA